MSHLLYCAVKYILSISQNFENLQLTQVCQLNLFWNPTCSSAITEGVVVTAAIVIVQTVIVALAVIALIQTLDIIS